MARFGKRYTIYDAMEEKGVFSANTANIDARDSDGASAYEKQHFPRMVYHPQGSTYVMVPPEEVVTPFGPAYRNTQLALVNKIAKDEVELEKLLAAGWHLHPAKAIAASGAEPPAMGLDAQIEDQAVATADALRSAQQARSEAEALKAELEALRAELLAEKGRDAAAPLRGLGVKRPPAET